MARTCPDCKLDLKAQSFWGVIVDVCPRCAGIFFDEGEINRLRLDGNDAMARVDEEVRPTAEFLISFRDMTEDCRHCPSCKSGMEKLRYLYNSPVMLDSCPDCSGVWVEDGELRGMQDVLISEGRKFGSKVRADISTSRASNGPEAHASRVNRLEHATSLFGRRLS